MTTAALDPPSGNDPLLKVPKITVYFWMAKLLTTAMGEATSDFLVFHTNPYLAVVGCGLLFLAAIWLQMRSNQYTAHYNEIAAFWIAYILTRPLGASFADWTDKPIRFGGLGLGSGPVSISLTLVILMLLTFLIISRVDDPNRA